VWSDAVYCINHQVAAGEGIGVQEVEVGFGKEEKAY
jgi:hypothetical protein